MKISVIIFLFVNSLLSRERPDILVNTAWQFVGYITPNDTTHYSPDIEYIIDFLPGKKISVKTSFTSDDRRSTGKYKLDGNEITINVFIPKGTNSTIDETLAFEEFNLRLRYNKSLNGRNTFQIREGYLILKREGLHSMLFKAKKE
jgi:hypothetical protein